jgi:hypothetical protein
MGTVGGFGWPVVCDAKERGDRRDTWQSTSIRIPRG